MKHQEGNENFMNKVQIHYFITLASTLNFTKASELLFITQSALSKQIIALEDDLGFPLLIRNKRNVKLTHAGESFLKDMLEVDKLYRQAVHKGSSIHSGINDNLSIGYCGFALFDILPSLIDEVKKTQPNITLSIHDCSEKYKAEDIFTNGVEVCFMPDFQSTYIKNYKQALVFSDDFCVVCNKNHRLAKLDSVSMYDLINEEFILTNKAPTMQDHDFIANWCSEYGFLPNVVKTTPSLHHSLLMINAGFGIAILAKHMTCLSNDNLVFVPITEGKDHFRLLAIWSKINDKYITQLVDTVTNLYKNS